MKNLKTKLKIGIIAISLLSINLFAQDYVYNGIKNVEATIGINKDEGGSGQETVSEECYTAPIGSFGKWEGCEGLLIVDNTMLRNMVSNQNIKTTENNYSDTNIFTGKVTDMSYLFCNMNHSSYPKCTLKQPIYSISGWNTENVIDMQYMFRDLYDFNQPLNNWNVSNVTNMKAMFYNAGSFNQPLNNWNVSNVTNMHSMFRLSSSFNQPINNWNVSSVTNMHGMFYNARSFNQPLNNWNVSNVTIMSVMFYSASNFYQDISKWCLPLISEKPITFDIYSGFKGQEIIQPNWGYCP